jgi:hypothetical protein
MGGLLYVAGTGRKGRTKCLVVFTQIGEGVKVDVAMEMHVGPAQGQVRDGAFERKDALDAPRVAVIL